MPKTTLPFYWVDAFADRLFSGNPAGVVLLQQWPADAVLQQIAFEHGLAETAFIVRAGPSRFGLRWFAPTAEVDLCGHATLASAFILFQYLGQGGPEITFESRSGTLVVRRNENGMFELDFPVLGTVRETGEGLVALVGAALGVTPVFVGRTPWDLLVEVEVAQIVEQLRPDLAKIGALGGRGVIVTAAGGKRGDFVSRFFAPQIGVPEDPVSGSTHCALAPFWSDRLGKTKLEGWQASPRGGTVWCEVVGDRVVLGGRAVLYLKGEIQLGSI